MPNMLGHNGGPSMSDADQRLKAFIDRVATLMLEKRQAMKDFTADIAEVIKEATGAGYDAKWLRKTAAEVVRRDLMDADDFKEEEAMLAMYFRAAGLDIVLDEEEGE